MSDTAAYIDERIRDALIPFGYRVEKNVFQHDDPIYFTFNYNTIGADFADDAPGHVRYLIQVHLFAPLDMSDLSLRASTASALLDAGFTFPDIWDFTDETGRHTVFEFEEAGGV